MNGSCKQRGSFKSHICLEWGGISKTHDDESSLENLKLTCHVDRKKNVPKETVINISSFFKGISEQGIVGIVRRKTLLRNINYRKLWRAIIVLHPERIRHRKYVREVCATGNGVVENKIDGMSSVSR